MDTLVKMRGREDKDLVGDVCFIKGQAKGCMRTRSFTGHPYRPKYWWVTDLDITILSTVEVL